MKANSAPMCTILWADDDMDDQHIIRDIVDSISGKYQVRGVSNGLQVFEYLDATLNQSTFPCLVVLDINMPLLNGKQTLTRIKADEKYRDLPVAIFTTTDNANDRLFCKSFGIPMITKPDSYRDFVASVKLLLGLCTSQNGKGSCPS